MDRLLRLAEGLNPYKYPTELVSGQIRLLKLIDASDGLLRFTFRTVLLPSVTSSGAAAAAAIIPYTALSYVWGSEDEKCPIVVDGAHLMVTQNCLIALSCMVRRLSRGALLWVDAICINQRSQVGSDSSNAASGIDSEREKAVQIAQMGEIYNCASEVIVCLGWESEGSDTAMRDVRRVGREALEAGIGALESGHPTDTPTDGWRKHHEIIRSRINILIQHNIGRFFFSRPKIATGAMVELLERPWFTRAWVIQEVILPEPGNVTFICGKQECSAEEMWAAAMLLGMMQDRLTKSLERTPGWLLRWKTIRRLQLVRYMRTVGVPPAWTDERSAAGLHLRQEYWASEKNAFSLKRVLRTLYVGDIYPPLRCRDPEDRIRAVHGLAGHDKEWLTPLLTKQPILTWVELYTSVAGHLIANGHVDLLSMCRDNTRDGSLPSWVPDWRHRIREPWSGIKGADQRFKASLDATCQVSFDSSALIIQGHSIDRISKTGSTWTADFGQRFDWDEANTLLSEVQSLLEGSSYTASERDEASWKIPIGDKELDANLDCIKAGDNSRAGYLLLRRALQMSTPQQYGLNAEVMSYNVMMGMMHRSRPFVSERGYVGLCPCEAKAGATVFIPLGAHVPYVIERAADEGTSGQQELGEWRLLGEAFVYGIMYGELNLTSRSGQEDVVRLV